MKVEKKAYENTVGILSRRLQAALTEKKTAEVDQVKVKTWVSDAEPNEIIANKF